MKTDPIVEEIRQNAEDLAKKTGGNLHGLMGFILSEQKKIKNLKRFPPKPRYSATGTDGH